jgi:hypothetical protein
MKTTYLGTDFFDQWIIEFFSVKKQGRTVYGFEIVQQGSEAEYQSQNLYPTEFAAHQAAYFFLIRASLDRENLPSLLLELSSGRILSINLPGFDLLGINAAGLYMTDFWVNPEERSQIYQALSNSKQFNQRCQLRNADGCQIDCQLHGSLTPRHEDWAIIHITSPITTWSVPDKTFSKTSVLPR